MDDGEANGHRRERRLVFGRLHFFDNSVRQVGPCPAADSRVELERFEAARAETLGILDALQLRAQEEAGPDEARIFEIHRIMLTDPDFEDRVTDRIVRQGLTAEYAVQEAGPGTCADAGGDGRRLHAGTQRGRDRRVQRGHAAAARRKGGGSAGARSGAVGARGAPPAAQRGGADRAGAGCSRSSRAGARRCPTPASSRARWGCPP